MDDLHGYAWLPTAFLVWMRLHQLKLDIIQDNTPSSPGSSSASNSSMPIPNGTELRNYIPRLDTPCCDCALGPMAFKATKTLMRSSYPEFQYVQIRMLYRQKPSDFLQKLLDECYGEQPMKVALPPHISLFNYLPYRHKRSGLQAVDHYRALTEKTALGLRPLQVDLTEVVRTQWALDKVRGLDKGY